MRSTRVVVRAIDWRWAVVVALGLASRLPYLSDRSIWYDEASSWQTARFGWTDFLESIRLNVHLPLYYLLLKAWMALFGESASALRGFSVAFGLLTVVLIGQFGRELFRASAACREPDSSTEPAEARAFGLALALLVALSPVQVLASIEARMYSMGTAFAAMSGWLSLRILRTDGGMRQWAAYGLSLLGLLYSHHYGLFSVAAQAVFLGLYMVWFVGAGRREDARRLLLASAIVGVLVFAAYLPALDILKIQSNRVQQDYWIRPLSWETVSGTFSQFFIPDHDELPRFGGWILLGLFGASSLVLLIGGRRGEGLVLASAILPLIFSASVSTITPVWVGRYFRFAHLFMIATMALAVWRVTEQSARLRSLAIAGMAAGLLYANVAFWERLDLSRNPGMRGAVSAILERIRPGESIVALDTVQYVPAKFYVGRRAPIHLIEPSADMFWGWHLIRHDDVISLEELRRELREGVWTIGTLRVPIVSPDFDLGQHTPRATFHFRYHMELHRNIYVHYYKIPDDRDSGDGADRTGED